MDIAFKYLETHKIEKESDYPYQGTDGKCQEDASKGVFSIKSYVDVPQNNTLELETAVAKGPVSVAIEADTFIF